MVIYEVYSEEALNDTVAAYKRSHGYEVFTHTNHSVILRRPNWTIWWITAIALVSALAIFLVRANTFEWQPIIASTVAWGAFLVVWALAALASILQYPMIQIDLNEDDQDEEE